MPSEENLFIFALVLIGFELKIQCIIIKVSFRQKNQIHNQNIQFKFKKIKFKLNSKEINLNSKEIKNRKHLRIKFNDAIKKNENNLQI